KSWKSGFANSIVCHPRVRRREDRWIGPVSRDLEVRDCHGRKDPECKAAEPRLHLRGRVRSSVEDLYLRRRRLLPSSDGRLNGTRSIAHNDTNARLKSGWSPRTYGRNPKSRRRANTAALR